MTTSSSRKIVAVVLPSLLCELAFPDAFALGETNQGESRSRKLLGVVESQGPGVSGKTLSEAGLGNVLLAVNSAAHQSGIRIGQTVAEARAIASNLVLGEVSRREWLAALGRIVEALLAFSSNVGFELGSAPTTGDTVWLDVTSSERLFGGESALLREIASRVGRLGHRARLAVRAGPVLARAFAIMKGGTDFHSFPVEVLPLSSDLVTWLARLGIWKVGDLLQLPASALRPRIGPWADLVLELLQNRDEVPIVSHQPEEAPLERVSWDEPADSLPPLLFGLRTITARLSARLEGRGQAARMLELRASYDHSYRKLRNLEEPGFKLEIDLATAMAKERELFRVLKSKLEPVSLLAPIRSVSVCAKALVAASVVQMELGGNITTSADPRELSILLSELAAQIGEENVGVLGVRPVHKPEDKSVLLPVDRTAKAFSEGHDFSAYPSRLLPRPIRIDEKPVRGASVVVGSQIFTLRSLAHPVRFENLDWHTSKPVSRDYARAELVCGNKVIEAWIFTDRTTGETYVHGFYD